MVIFMHDAGNCITLPPLPHKSLVAHFYVVCGVCACVGACVCVFVCCVCVCMCVCVCVCVCVHWCVINACTTTVENKLEVGS